MTKGRKKRERERERRRVLINIRVLYIRCLDARKERKRRPDNNLSFFTRKKTSALEISEDAFTPTILAAIVFFFRSLSPHAQPAIPLSSLHSPLLQQRRALRTIHSTTGQEGTMGRACFTLSTIQPALFSSIYL